MNTEVIMEPMVIEVLGVPCIPPHDRMVDQLKIHFQKRRYSGGDVLSVIYPTATPAQAYVIFESAEVPGVLECTHVLDVDTRFYAIHVKRANFSEVDMRVETILDLRMFKDRKYVLTCLKHYDFNVTKSSESHLQLKGSFLKLKLLRTELLRLQVHEHQLHNRSPSALHNGFSYDTEHNSLDHRLASKSMSRNVHNMDAVSQRQLLDGAPSLSSPYREMASAGSPRSLQSSYSPYAERNASSPVNAVQKYQSQDSSELLAHRWSPLADGASPLSANSPSSLTLLHHTSPLHSDSASGGSLRRCPSYDSGTWARSSHSSPQSFPVDTDTLNFILSQQQDVVKVINDYGTEMRVKGDAGLTVVSLFGKNSEKAKAHLLEKIKEISPSLRTQEIYLKMYTPAEQTQILERIQRYKDSGVMITHSGDDVKLVGSSKGSFEMKQKLLGHNDDSRRGRTMDRSSKSRRCSSVPRQYKAIEHKLATDQENQASAANMYSPASYQEESDEGKAPQIVQGKTQNKNSQRTRSNSESRDKNRIITAQPMHQDMELVSSSQGKKSQKIPFLKALQPSLRIMTLKKNGSKKK
ncbi:uncharacterized protein si:dkey-154b15.1 isoform X2 [Neoarius graeffei]|uniref:uncharacterized protein si:dkey-154b15.1 isoform X2 n=1 Tax=Neoarius graeffei TaxID=443677 RepID=UPI00298C6FAD|nr:uncharacterized protein si:dkey-154b15.1 isoform X2 [Neoarius graeffei]